MMKTVLVTGGAGYVGSHTVEYLQEKGLRVVVLDDFSTGRQGVLGRNVPVVEGDVRDEKSLERIFARYAIDAVFHFAALSIVAESRREPLRYYDVNVGGTLTLLKCMARHNVGKLIFSSTAAVYGTPAVSPIRENAPTSPISPYGQSKLFAEKILEAAGQYPGLRFVSLRYFNAAGAGYGIGEAHEPETHLIPCVLEVAAGKRKRAAIFGNNYPTKDGTCIRDYVHVIDLAAAHYLAYSSIRQKKQSRIYNLGSGSGYSVKEVIAMCREVTGQPIHATLAGRREGDAAILVASSRKIQKELGWKPRYGLRDMIKSAWELYR